MLTCPSDSPEQRTNNWYFPTEGPYRYSYSLNAFLVGNPFISRGPIKLFGVRRSAELVMVVEELGRTTAELPPEQKHRISHRGKALRRLSALMTRVGMAC